MSSCSKGYKTLNSYSEHTRAGDQSTFLSTVEILLSSDIYEQKMAGIFLLGRYMQDNRDVELDELTQLIETYVREWSVCDTFATDVLAPMLLRNWENGKNTLHTWSKSPNLWLRRLVLVGVIKCKQGPENWQEFVDILLTDFSNEKEKHVIMARRWLQKERLTASK